MENETKTWPRWAWQGAHHKWEAIQLARVCLFS